MLQSLRQSLRRTLVPAVPAQPLLAAGTILGFGWLLLNDRIPALVVYCLELYLSF